MAGTAAGSSVTAAALLAALLLEIDRAIPGTAAACLSRGRSLRLIELAQSSNRCQQDACQGKNGQQDADRYVKNCTFHFFIKIEVRHHPVKPFHLFHAAQTAPTGHG